MFIPILQTTFEAWVKKRSIFEWYMYMPIGQVLIINLIFNQIFNINEEIIILPFNYIIIFFLFFFILLK